MAYEIIWEPEGVIRQFSGSVSAREFMQSVEQVQGDSRYDDMRYIINDFSSATAAALNEEVFTKSICRRGSTSGWKRWCGTCGAMR